MVSRNRYPRLLNRIIDYIADHPESIPGRIAARRLGKPEPAGSVGVTEFTPGKDTRVLIAPVNYSAQAYAFARALEAADAGISARNMAYAVPGSFGFNSDLTVPLGTFHNDSDWQRQQLAAAKQATHFLLEAQEPPFGRLLGRAYKRQLAELMAAGVSCAYLAHGVEVRLPSRHKQSDRWSYFHDPEVYSDRAETVAARNIAWLESRAQPVFVSTPDLLLDLPRAIWCPVVVDVPRWQRAGTAWTDTARVGIEQPGAAALPEAQPRQNAQTRPLRVVHAPSIQAVKGTAQILPAMQRLHDAGVIEFELLKRVPAAEMPAKLAAADVVLDQFRIGSYGVVACEAMAAGCIVVGHISAETRQQVLQHTGLELPIVEADIESLERVIRELASADEATHDRLRSEGLSFVQRVHSGQLSAQILIDNWIARDKIGGEEGLEAKDSDAPQG